MDIILGIIASVLAWKAVVFCIRMNRLNDYQNSYIVQHDRLTASGQHKQARALSDEFDLKVWAAYGVRPTSETVLAIARIKQEVETERQLRIWRAANPGNRTHRSEYGVQPTPETVAERQFTSWDWENTCR